jgi:glycosyltransferase involved in cell wall biosynthesis
MTAPLRLLIAQHRWWYPTAVSGADIANYEFACRMVEKGIEVAVHGVMPPGDSRRIQSRKYISGGVDIRLYKSDFLKHLRKQLRTFKPDVVLTTCPEPNCGTDDITRMVEAIQNAGIPVALYVHDLESTLPLFNDVKAHLAVVISNSRFMASQVAKLWSVSCEVVYPVPDWRPFYTDGSDGPFITFFNPLPHKGLGIAHTLVMRRFPNRPFLFVEGFIDPEQHGINLSRSGNLVHARRSPDVATIYSMSHVVIIPSQWQEPFGRIALEAMLSDVPVVASRTGGLPESVGEGGILIDDFSNAERWAEAIESLQDERVRQKWISAGRRHVKKFSLETQVKKLIAILKGISKVC